MDFEEVLKILDLPPNASMEEIKTAYKNKAKQLHPDKNINEKELAEEDFKKLSEAYNIMKNSKNSGPKISKSKHRSRTSEQQRKKVEYDTSISIDQLFDAIFSSFFGREFATPETHRKKSSFSSTRCRHDNSPHTVCLKCNRR